MLVWLGFEILWKLQSVWNSFFLSKDLSKAFIGRKTPFHSTFLFQDKKTYIWCNMMYDFAWMTCLCIRFTFMIFSYYSATFLPMYTLWTCWCYLFLLFLRRYFRLDACPSHRISFSNLGNKNRSCSSLYVWNTCFFLCSRLHNSRDVSKFRINNEKSLTQYN